MNDHFLISETDLFFDSNAISKSDIVLI